jgi:hypothetical protein
VETAAKTVEFIVDVRHMRVLDPNLSADKRSQVQEKMLSPDALDPDRYPEIAFRSTRVEQQSGGELSVSGNLMLHGQTQPIQSTRREHSTSLSRDGSAQTDGIRDHANHCWRRYDQREGLGKDRL